MLEIGLFPLVFGLIIPWGYVWRHYVRRAGGALALTETPPVRLRACVM